ncbi:hypothetical protein O3P69_004000 [Scylla paramamosain]|uniref:Pro-resilin n=1 Tax=Scylla paramamosain TaxID=85552 RepID=A0AAW0UEM6_SCYPA
MHDYPPPPLPPQCLINTFASPRWKQVSPLFVQGHCSPRGEQSAWGYKVWLHSSRRQCRPALTDAAPPAMIRPRPTPYAYNYGVSAGYTNFGQSEKGNGYGGVHGGYWVNLPDGRVQRVSYVADYSGFHPVVTYSGKAHYPASYGYGHGGGYH